jgi:hypothetical protein
MVPIFPTRMKQLNCPSSSEIPNLFFQISALFIYAFLIGVIRA